MKFSIYCVVLATMALMTISAMPLRRMDAQPPVINDVADFEDFDIAMDPVEQQENPIPLDNPNNDALEIIDNPHTEDADEDEFDDNEYVKIGQDGEEIVDDDNDVDEEQDGFPDMETLSPEPVDEELDEDTEEPVNLKKDDNVVRIRSQYAHYPYGSFKLF